MARSKRSRGTGAFRHLEWNDDQLKLLGTASDAKVAEQLGNTPNAVYLKRHQLGIAAFGPSTEEKRHRWTKRELAMLGTLPDSEIAGRIGLSTIAVRHKRGCLGIPPSTGPARARGPKWTKRRLSWLGKLHAKARLASSVSPPSIAARFVRRQWTDSR